jgi:hypothetical protein
MTKLIVAYGVNDCVPGTVVIGKANVLCMLFIPVYTPKRFRTMHTI